MNKLFGAVMLIGAGVAIGMNWRRIQDEVLPRFTDAQADSWDAGRESGVAL